MYLFIYIDVKSISKKFKNMKLEDKWGSKVLEFGWTAVPTALFLLQKELELNPTQLNVLLNIILHWWGEDKPHPSQKVLLNEWASHQKQSKGPYSL